MGPIYIFWAPPNVGTLSLSLSLSVSLFLSLSLSLSLSLPPHTHKYIYIIHMYLLLEPYLESQRPWIMGYFGSSMGYCRAEWPVILGYLAFQVEELLGIGVGSAPDLRAKATAEPTAARPKSSDAKPEALELAKVPARSGCNPLRPGYTITKAKTRNS